jgi:hypothetical protein
MTEVEGPFALKIVLQNDWDSEAEAQRYTFLISDLEKSDQIHALLFSIHQDHPDCHNKLNSGSSIGKLATACF